MSNKLTFLVSFVLVLSIGAGHSVHRDQKERLLKALKAFLGEL